MIFNYLQKSAFINLIIYQGLKEHCFDNIAVLRATHYLYTINPNWLAPKFSDPGKCIPAVYILANDISFTMYVEVKGCLMSSMHVLETAFVCIFCESRFHSFSEQLHLSANQSAHCGWFLKPKRNLQQNEVAVYPRITGP